MCGIFSIFSSQPKILEDAFLKKENILNTIKLRGPDKTNIIREKIFFALHTLLSITGFAEQPILNDNFMLLYNGEIYNDYKNYTPDYSDTQYLCAQISDKGSAAFQYLDGEFAICLYERKSNTLFLATDPFGTKPLYYQLGPNYCIIGTYASTVSACKEKGPVIQVAANTLIEIDLDNYKIKATTRIREFDFAHQEERTFEKWNQAFTQAILKRTLNAKHNCFISFSSGHDTGLIAASMLENKISFYVYSIPCGEDLSVLNERIDILKKYGVNCDVFTPTRKDYESMGEFLLENCEAYQLINPESKFRNFENPDMRRVSGYIASAIIHKKAKHNGHLISLSGQGADEVIADYYNEYANSDMSELKGRWEKATSPWKNFFGGWNRVFLGGSERIAGLFGIETRYPYLDFAVVQEFLNLHPELKSKLYKAPITNRLMELGFPYHLKKYGFVGFCQTTS